MGLGTGLAAATDDVLNKAAKGAAKPKASHLDVWNYGVQGMEQGLESLKTKTPEDIAKASLEDVGKAVAGRDWDSSSGKGCLKAMEQQGKSLVKQAYELLPFVDSKTAPKGVLAHLGSALGLITSAEQMLSAATSFIPAPALPAVRIGDFDIGLPHAHPHPPNTPPAPPVPLPSTGPVIPIPIMSGAGSVLINGRPAARCGDMGIGIWCGGYFPMYEIFLGSSNVWVEGARAARVATDVTKHCTFSNPKPAKPEDKPIGPMFGFTITASSDVMIGGIPMPSLTAKAMGGMFKALFKQLGKLLGKLRGALGKLKPKGKSSLAKLPDVRGPARNCSPFKGGKPHIVGKTDFVTDAAMRESRELIDKMKASRQLTFDPNGSYAAKAENQLAMVCCDPNMRGALKEIADSGQKLHIEPPPRGGDPCCIYDTHQAGWDLKTGKSGTGSGSTIQYDPDAWFGPKSPPDTVLAHELGHARNASEGVVASNVPMRTPEETRRWTDLEEYNVINDYDNPYRDKRGLDKRTGHDDLP
jgi:uncharacterized Zn-binding protein involved in type VI secretion